MTIPTFCFLQRDAASRETEREFLRQLIATGRFWRNEKSQIMFKVGSDDYVLIERKQGFRSILEDGDVLKLTGDLDDTCFDILWIWITAAKWKLPRLNPEKAWNPPTPKPISRVGFEFNRTVRS